MYVVLGQTCYDRTGHVVHMADVRIRKQLFYGELKSGKRPQHKLRKIFKDSIKNKLKQLQLDVDTWEEFAKDRCKWRSCTSCKSAAGLKSHLYGAMKEVLLLGWIQTLVVLNETAIICEDGAIIIIIIMYVVCPLWYS